MPIGYIWQTFLETPLINFLVALSAIAFGSYGLAILLFTVITRVVTFPLTLRTLHATRRLQELNPRIQEIQKRYSDPRRRTEETMKLYKEAGVNPIGCLGGQLVQFPIFIALYQVIRITLGVTPEALLHLEDRLYDFAFLSHAIPLSEDFLGVNLAQQGHIPFTVLVFASMWLQQRISSSRTTARDSQQAQMNQMMQWWMPLLFAWFAFASPAGLALYWTATTTIGIVLQWQFVGPGDFTWGSLVPAPARAALGMGPAAPRKPHDTSAGGATGVASATDADDGSGTRSSDGSDRRGQRGQRRRGNRPGSQATRPQPRPGGSRRRSRG